MMTIKICTVEGCNRKSMRHGLCNMHSQRVYAGKSVGPAEPLRAPNGSGDISSGYRVFGKKAEHITIAEKALGHALPVGAVVHHVNEDRLDNRPENLVICQNQAYHVLLHRRMRALEECGHADWMKCEFCHQYDTPENLYIRPNKYAGFHRSCSAKHARDKRNGTL